MADANHIDTVIIGASAAGLASAVCLKQHEIPFILLEQYDHVASEWSNRYDRLHLHTPKNLSGMPYFKIPSIYPTYVSKNDYATYLKEYSETFDVKPLFNQKVIRAERKENMWEVITTKNKFISKNLIVATGYSGKPVKATWKGMDHYQGEIIHSSQYKNGAVYRNKKVLVVGFGNSACEIAICLHEHQALPSLSVRNGVNIIPRDLVGIPIINIVIVENWLTKLSPALTDLLNAPVLRLINGDIKKYGLQKLSYGPMTQVTKYKKVPLLDVGTMNLIKKGILKVYPGIEEIKPGGVKFTDGREENFDVIIAATGFNPAFAEFLQGFEKVSDASGMPLVSGRESGLPGLYFCGFHASPTGMLREIGIEAKRIARAIRCKVQGT